MLKSVQDLHVYSGRTQEGFPKHIDLISKNQKTTANATKPTNIDTPKE